MQLLKESLEENQKKNLEKPDFAATGNMKTGYMNICAPKIL